MTLSFKDYVGKGKVKQKTPDPEEAAALIQQAQERMVFAKGRKIIERNAKFVLEQAYEVVREAVQSLMSKQGFKPYSHEATVSFLAEYYPSDFTEEEISLFDRYRQLRSDSIYRAIKVEVQDAQECVSFAETMLQKIEKIVQREK